MYQIEIKAFYTKHANQYMKRHHLTVVCRNCFILSPND